VKIASRFPIKSNWLLLSLILIAHLGLISIAFILLTNFWSLLLIIVSTIGSGYFSLKQYQSITRAEDDLCWSGENWLMQDHQLKTVSYLDLMPTSWVTANFCLLKFEQNNVEKAWLFTRRSLGERLFRELCYLAKVEIGNQHQKKPR